MLPAEPPPHDTWAIGDHYEPFIGRWSRRVADGFLDWLAVQPGRSWLDVGCGTGALSEAIAKRVDPVAVHGIDPSAGFIGHARTRIADPRATFAVGDARALPVNDAAFDVAVAALVLNFVDPARQAVVEMTRAVRADGWVAAYVWDYAGRMELLRRFWDAAVTLDRAAHTLDESRRFPLCDPAALADLFAGAGLRDVETRAIDVETRFVDFDDYWQPFLGGQGPAPTYVASLSEDRRDALRDQIRAGLPIAADGSIALVARAWAVRGRVSR